MSYYVKVQTRSPPPVSSLVIRRLLRCIWRIMVVCTVKKRLARPADVAAPGCQWLAPTAPLKARDRPVVAAPITTQMDMSCRPGPAFAVHIKCTLAAQHVCPSPTTVVTMCLDHHPALHGVHGAIRRLKLCLPALLFISRHSYSRTLKESLVERRMGGGSLRLKIPPRLHVWWPILFLNTGTHTQRQT